MEEAPDTMMADNGFPSTGPGPLMNGHDKLDLVSSIFKPNVDPHRASRETSEVAHAADRLQLASNDSTMDDESVDEVILEVPYRPLVQYSSLPTGLCYDARMRFHTELNPPRQAIDYHPEDPRRILWIYRHLCEAGLVKGDKMSVEPIVSQPLERIIARPATAEELVTVHSEEHLEFMKQTATHDEAELTRLEKMYDSVYFNHSTYNCALLSAGGAIETCMAVAHGDRVKNAIAVIRPPGHHAEQCRPMGFCHFDNVSVAVHAVQKAFPERIRRVLILDWDVHHGNGIQQAFEENPNVLYISLHVHEDGMFYPSGNYGDHLHCGRGDGTGFNINIPWPTKGMGDSDYLFAFQHVVMPVAMDFNPNLVVIAAGFDAAHGDQLGGCFVTPAAYAHMTYMLKSLAGGRLVACLEGGYNLEAISRSALAVTRVLMGEAPPQIAQRAATKACVETVKKVIATQAHYWKCLTPRPAPDFEDLPFSDRLHDVIRRDQARYHSMNNNLEPVYIFREQQSKSFENQVIATSNWDTNDQPLLMIFHDPPEMIGEVDPMTGQIHPEQAIVADLTKHYIDWAIKEGFAVIDINIPKFLTGLTDPEATDKEIKEESQKLANELAVYLWENYVEVNGVEQVLFLGIGDAYKSALHILNSRAYERLACWKASVCFVSATPIFAVHEEFFSQLGKYYQKRSKIFVNKDHPVWDPDRGKRPSKKFGKLVRSEGTSLSRMMWEHHAEVEEFLKASVVWEKYPEREGQREVVGRGVTVKRESPRKEAAVVNERDRDRGRDRENGGDMEDTIMVGSAS